MAKEEENRMASRKEILGEPGLFKLAQELENAIAANGVT